MKSRTTPIKVPSFVNNQHLEPKKIRRGLSTKAIAIVQSSQRADFVRNSRVYNLSPTKIHDGMKVPMTTPIAAPVLFWSPLGGTGN